MNSQELRRLESIKNTFISIISEAHTQINFINEILKENESFNNDVKKYDACHDLIESGYFTAAELERDKSIISSVNNAAAKGLTPKDIKEKINVANKNNKAGKVKNKAAYLNRLLTNLLSDRGQL